MLTTVMVMNYLPYPETVQLRKEVPILAIAKTATVALSCPFVVLKDRWAR